MHMMSKKRIQFRRTGYFEKVENPNSGTDCQRRSAHHEEVQVFVHDQNLIVTVQSAVPSLENLRRPRIHSREC